MKWLLNESPFIISTQSQDKVTVEGVVCVCLCVYALFAVTTVDFTDKKLSFSVRLICLVYVRVCPCIHMCMFFFFLFSVYVRICCMCTYTCNVMSERHWDRSEGSVCVCVHMTKCVQRKQELNFKSRFNTNKNDIFLFSSWYFITVISLTWGPLQRESREWSIGNKQRKLHILWVAEIKLSNWDLMYCLSMSHFPVAASDTSVFCFFSPVQDNFHAWGVLVTLYLLFLYWTNRALISSVFFEHMY